MTDEYTAYCFDEVCMVWGSYVQSELESVTGKTESATRGKRELKLKALLSDSPAAKYAQPVATR